MPKLNSGHGALGVAANGGVTIATLSCPTASCRVPTKMVRVKIEALHRHRGRVLVRLRVRSSDGATTTTRGKLKLKK